MNLFQGFPTSPEDARREAQIAALSGRPQLPASGSLASGPSRTSLSPFGLSDDVFQPRPPSPRRPPQAPQLAAYQPDRRQESPPAPAEDIKAEGEALNNALNPKTDPAREALDRAEAALRRIPALPSDVFKRTDTAAQDAPGSIANYQGVPGAPGAPYFAALRGPEGTTDNPAARNKITDAAGPYQFLRGTWDDLAKSYPELGLTAAGHADPVNNLEQHEKAIRVYTDRSMKALVPQLGRLPTPGELYSMHLLGQGGGMRLLKNLDAPTEESISAAVFHSNPWMKKFASMPGRALLSHFEKQMGGV